jgi:hypothetical protein
MNYPKKDEYNPIKRLSKKERNTIGKLDEFLDLRFKFNPPERLKYGEFFIPLFKHYGIRDLSMFSFQFLYQYFGNFISNYRKEITSLKELLDIKDFYLYRYQNDRDGCSDDLAGILFKNKQQKMIFLLKHTEIIDTILK